MSRLYLIRHAKPAATWGQGDDPDPGLSAEGVSQALLARDQILSLPPAERPSLVVSSPLRRCRETAAPLAEALGVAVVIDPDVGEIPTPASLASADRAAWLKAAFRGRWRDIDGDRDYDEWRHGLARALLPRAGAAVFSHFVAINAVVATVQAREEVLAFQPDHASVTVLESDGRALTLIAKGREARTSVI